MIKIEKISPQEAYSNYRVFSTLNKLTNKGTEFALFGSAMSDALNNENKPIKKIVIAKDDILNQIIAWSCIIDDEKSKKHAHVYVHDSYRNQNIGKKLLNVLLENYQDGDVIFYPVSNLGYEIFKKYTSENNISKMFIIS